MCRVSHCLGESMVGATAHRLQGDVEYSSDAEGLTIAINAYIHQPLI